MAEAESRRKEEERPSRRFVTFDVDGHQEEIKKAAARYGWEEAVALISGARMMLPRNSLRSPVLPTNVAAADQFMAIVKEVEQALEVKITIQRMLVEAWTSNRVFRSMHHAD